MRQNDARFISLTMALFLACLGTPARATANSLSVDGNGLSAMDGDGKGYTAPQIVLTSGAGSQTIVMQDLRSATSPAFHKEITLLGAATASYGTLSGDLSAQAISQPGGPLTKTRGTFVLTFDDSGTVLSSTLPIGTPVSLDFTGQLASAVVVTGLPNYNHAGVLYEGYVIDLTTNENVNFTLANDGVFGPTPPSGIATRTLDTVVGHDLRFFGRLTVAAEVELVFDETGASAAVDAAHTAHLYFNPSPSSDVTLLSASGHNYAIPPGDVNFDGVVNIFDINLVSTHWAESGPVADANGDGAINIFDINLISANWTGGAVPVPEPASIVPSVIALLGLVALGWRRRR